MDSVDKTFIKALFTADYYKGYMALEEYVGAIVSSVLRDINILNYLQADYRSVDDVASHHKLHAQSKPFLEWALRYLEHRGYAQSKDSEFRVRPDVPDEDLAHNVKQILEFSPSAGTFVTLVELIRREIENFVFGRKSGGDILLSGGRTSSLWNDFFNNTFYGYSVINYGAAYGIAKWFSQTNGESMLELGSGTSGATIKVFQTMTSNNLLDRLQTIVLTDIIPSLMSTGKKNIEDQVDNPPRFEQRVLDINIPFGQQGFAEASFDIIYGVNVLHVAHDLRCSLKEIYNCLKSNGILVIAETVRPSDRLPMPHEIIFNLLENYHEVQLDPELRPYHGYLTKERWGKILDIARFRDIEYITELQRNDTLDFDLKPLHSFLILKGQK